jgi:hypothetical protein
MKIMDGVGLCRPLAAVVATVAMVFLRLVKTPLQCRTRPRRVGQPCGWPLGPRGSGKTLLLARMYHQMQTRPDGPTSSPPREPEVSLLTSNHGRGGHRPELGLRHGVLDSGRS